MAPDTRFLFAGRIRSRYTTDLLLHYRSAHSAFGEVESLLLNVFYDVDDPLQAKAETSHRQRPPGTYSIAAALPDVRLSGIGCLCQPASFLRLARSWRIAFRFFGRRMATLLDDV